MNKKLSRCDIVRKWNINIPVIPVIYTDASWYIEYKTEKPSTPR